MYFIYNYKNHNNYKNKNYNYNNKNYNKAFLYRIINRSLRKQSL